MFKIVKPNYDNCLTNITCSILKHFNCEYSFKTVDIIDRELEKNYQNVVLILYDGMGSKIIEKLPDSFLSINKKENLFSVFPSTTVAATTSVLSGTNPCNHGWLGWDLYFKNVDRTVTMFTNYYKNTCIKYSNESLAEKYYGYENIIDKINRKSHAYIISPYADKPYDNYDEMLNRIRELCNKKEKKFIYAYYPELDTLLHIYGTKGERVYKLLNEMNEKTEKLCNSVKDTLFIITADHGHINCSPIYLEDYPQIFNLLERTTSIEARACNFFIKDGNEALFKELFNKEFGNDFILYTRDEVINNNLFGIGIEHKYFEDSLGDFLAVAIADKFLWYENEEIGVLSMHAGLTEDEMLIPLIMIGR